MKFKRTFAALITAVSVLSLTACGKDEQPTVSNGGTGTQPSGNNSFSPSGGEGYLQGLNEQEIALEIERTHVRSCDSTAQSLLNVTKTYIADYEYNVWYENSGGGLFREAGVLAEITVVNGEPTVKMNGYNDTAVTEKVGTYEDFIKEGFGFTSEDNCKAVIYAKKNGMPCACVYSDRADAKLGNYEYDEDNDKIIVRVEWVSEDLPGVTPDGFYIGTYPKADSKGTLTA